MTSLEMSGGRDVAIVGMSVRFPGADTVDEFWQNLRNGVESITFFSDEALRATGVPDSLLSDPSFVKAQPLIKEPEYFDAGFFGYKPREAEAMDPQVRIFLECAWEALEGAGYDPERIQGPVGVYAGNNLSNYLIFNLLPVLDQVSTEGSVFGIVCYNDKDALATVVSHKLNLRGPSFSVQTFCSTSLVAVHLACQSLAIGEADMALAGGVSLGSAEIAGYYFEEGGIKSPDGHNRSFDARGKGTVFGNGAGVVVLKRLGDALADRDHIHAVIRGSAVNNDGSRKAGYTAPSVDGQAGAIRRALAVSGINPDSIGYVETHGTATAIGDPIEVQAMTKAFHDWTTRRQFCAIGSVKTNFGHLDRAAGVAGLIKAALVLEHRQIPPSLHFETPNPKIDFEQSPFFVNTQLREFTSNGSPRRAAVSSLGIGGTNAHVVLEEAPPAPPPAASRASQILVVSARTSTALERASERLAKFLRQNPGARLPDVCFTLQVGRRAFQHRSAIVGADADAMLHAIDTRDPQRVFTGAARSTGRAVAFLFPGQGAQHVQMGRGLYEAEPVFRREVDRACDELLAHAGWDLRPFLFPPAAEEAAAADALRQTRVTQPALFIIEHALAQMLRSWGVTPAAMLGHSIGEFVAACVSGVMTLEQAVRLVAARGALMQELPTGSMLAVPLPEHELTRFLSDDVSLAAVNAEQSCVIAGPAKAIATVERALDAAGVAGRLLATSHAFHSSMMDPILDTFTRLVEAVPLRAPTIPYVSNVTGDWITAEQATDPAYWTHHLRHTVRFGDGLTTLLGEREYQALEVGPGRTLSQLARRQAEGDPTLMPVTTLHRSNGSGSDLELAVAALGQLWVSGVDVEWEAFWGAEQRSRVALPTYPFERQKYWIAPSGQARASSVMAPATARAELADWFYAPTWKRGPAPGPFKAGGAPATWLVLADDTPMTAAVVDRLSETGEQVVTVATGPEFRAVDDRRFTIDPAQPDHWSALFDALVRGAQVPSKVVSLWSLSAGLTGTGLEHYDEAQTRGFFSALHLVQTLGDRTLPARVDIGLLTDGLHNVKGTPSLAPERATLLGPCRVTSQEYPDITCRNIDIDADFGAPPSEIAALVLGELTAGDTDPVVAYRGGYRWTPAFERLRLGPGASNPGALGFRDRGAYLITGGLGGLGLVIAEHLAGARHARLALLQRSGLPEESTWDAWLAAHDDDSDRVSRRIRAVQRMRDRGGEVMVVSADVARLEDMQRAVEVVESRFGAIDGVIHAAGVAGDGVMQLKTRAIASGVVDPKVKGALILSHLFAEKPLDFLALFSSTAAVFGSFGQVDYTGANGFLDVFASGQRPGSRWPLVSIGWDAWGEVGMAVETQSRPTAVRGRTDPTFTPIAHAYFNRRRTEGETTIFAGDFSADRLWFLNEHRLYGHPTLPSTSYLEIARSVFAPIAGDRIVEVRDVFFLAPCAVPEGQSRLVECELTGSGDERDFVLRSRGQDEDTWVQHSRGRLVAVAPTERAPADLAALAAACPTVRLDNPEPVWEQIAGQIQQVGSHLALGPRWVNLRQMRTGEDRELLRQALPRALSGDVDTTPLHPALLDFTGLMPLETEGTYIPFSFDCVRLLAPLPSAIVTSILNRDDLLSGKETVVFDATLMNDAGRPLVEIEGMTLRRVDQMDAYAAGIAREVPSATTASRAGGPPADQENFRLVTDTPGVFSAFEWRPAARTMPAPGQIEIEVASAGLNFKDVLRALGMIPGMPGGDVAAGFGSECAGRITRVGEGVTSLRPGDDVMAIAPTAFSAFTVTLEDLAAPIPAGLGFGQAATIPLVFLTAYHALVNQAGLAAGERVLIHAASGGVGLAAIQIARHIGAEIYATAGNPAKHEYLRSLGVGHVTSSRALTFADDVREWTDGEGVDVVLNSLAGEFIPAGLALLRPFGRFVELGARDIYENAALRLRPFGNNLSFMAVDLGPMFVARPDRVRRMFHTILERLARGDYQPLPVQTFAMGDAEQAFEFMAAARHIGKIALEVQSLSRRAGAPRALVQAAPGADAPALPTDLGNRIAPREGVEALGRVLASRHPHVVVSPRDLQGLADWQRRAVQSLQDAAAKAPVHTRVQLPRPDLATPFVAPRTEEEIAIADIWRGLLGLQEVGIHDNFFELGGDSLIGVQVLSRIRKAFEVQLPASVLYEGPTVERLAVLAKGEVPDEEAAFAQQRGRGERRRERQRKRGQA